MSVRHTSAVRLPVPAGAPALADTGSRMQAGSLKVRVHRGERVTARWAPVGNFDTPPVFKGRVVHEPSGTVVSGVVREVRVRVIVPALCLLLCALGVLTLVLGIGGVGNRPTEIGFGIGLTAIFALLTIATSHNRSRRFQEGAEVLQDGMQTYLESGHADRPSW